jgi:hypothetical protein
MFFPSHHLFWIWLPFCFFVHEWRGSIFTMGGIYRRLPQCLQIFCRLRFGMRALRPVNNPPDRMVLLQIPDGWGNTHSFLRFSKRGGHLGMQRTSIDWTPYRGNVQITVRQLETITGTLMWP